MKGKRETPSSNGDQTDQNPASAPNVKQFNNNRNLSLEASKTKDDSTTKAYHGSGVWKGPRKVVSLRVDKNLYSAFKPVAKHVFGSVCRPIEAFMAAVVACADEQVSFGTTVDIEKVVIERNLRSRRALEVPGSPAIEPSVETLGSLDSCCYQGCHGHVTHRTSVVEGLSTVYRFVCGERFEEEYYREKRRNRQRF